MPRKTRFEVSVGQRFGRLVVLRLSHKNARGDFFACRCDCGKENVVGRANLFRVKSCGCFRRENTTKMRTTHGMSRRGHPHHYLYQLWSGIKRRCYNENEKGYADYGGRGIKIHPKWRNDFVAFSNYVLETIGHKPNGLYSLDRINNDGSYVPGNIRWLSYQDQARNTRRTIRLKWGTGRITLRDFCERFRINYDQAWAFLNSPEIKRRIDWENHRHPPSQPPGP